MDHEQTDAILPSKVTEWRDRVIVTVVQTGTRSLSGSNSFERVKDHKPWTGPAFDPFLSLQDSILIKSRPTRREEQSLRRRVTGQGYPQSIL